MFATAVAKRFMIFGILTFLSNLTFLRRNSSSLRFCVTKPPLSRNESDGTGFGLLDDGLLDGRFLDGSRRCLPWAFFAAADALELRQMLSRPDGGGTKERAGRSVRVDHERSSAAQEVGALKCWPVQVKLLEVERKLQLDVEHHYEAV